MRALHWEEAVGKRFELGQGPQAQKGTVVGVVKDFNFSSVHEGVGPFAIYRQVEDFSRVPQVLRLHEERTMVVNIAGRDVPATMRIRRRHACASSTGDASVRVRVRRRLARQALTSRTSGSRG